MCRAARRRAARPAQKQNLQSNPIPHSVSHCRIYIKSSRNQICNVKRYRASGCFASFTFELGAQRIDAPRAQFLLHVCVFISISVIFKLRKIPGAFDDLFFKKHNWFLFVLIKSRFPWIILWQFCFFYLKINISMFHKSFERKSCISIWNLDVCRNQLISYVFNKISINKKHDSCKNNSFGLQACNFYDLMSLQSHRRASAE